MQRREWMNPGDPEAEIELTDILDEGASGAVFEGLLKSERVAIKVIPGLDDAAINSEIHDEITILRKIASNPHFVGFRGAWEKENHAWVAMELCEGGSAIDLCQICQTTFKPEECSALCASVLMGLKFLHENLGIVHRDIKGKNILISRDGRVKITDLGIAVQSPEASKSHAPVLPAGSPHWMAPELASKNLTCFVNDIWSLGVTLIELVEGEPPHCDVPPHDVLKVIEDSPSPQFSAETKKKVGVDLPAFLASCVVKDPAKRPTTSKLLRHPYVDACVMHLMVSDKPQPAIKALMERAFPILTDYREFERRQRITDMEHEAETTATSSQTSTSATAAKEPAATAAPAAPKPKAKWSEADGDLFIVDDEPVSQPVAPAKSAVPKAPSSAAPASSKPKVKWSEAEGDLVVLGETSPATPPAKPKVKWSEADGDLVVLDDTKSHNRASVKMNYIEAREKDNSSPYKHNLEELNANRAWLSPESIRASERLVQTRQSARRQSEVGRDSEQVKKMQARLAQIQSRFDKTNSDMKRRLPQGAFQ